jgi:hypothetical protein
LAFIVYAKFFARWVTESGFDDRIKTVIILLDDALGQKGMHHILVFDFVIAIEIKIHRFLEPMSAHQIRK